MVATKTEDEESSCERFKASDAFFCALPCLEGLALYMYAHGHAHELMSCVLPGQNLVRCSGSSNLSDHWQHIFPFRARVVLGCC